LDVGCGFGTFMKLFGDKGWNTTGIDISEERINYAQSQGLNCYLSSIENFYPDRKFDVIIMHHVIEHFQNPLPILERAKDWINENGIIYIRVLNVDAKAIHFSKAIFIGHVKPFEHLYYFSPRTLKLLIEKAELEVSIHLDSYGFMRDILNYWIRSKIVLKPSWIKINYETTTEGKKRYLFFRDFYEKAVDMLRYIPLGPKDREIVAIARKKK